MQAPETPVDEIARIDALRALNILDTAPEERFERLTRLAKRVFNVPIALVSLIDEKRLWFKSHPGFDVSETPRELSFCGHAILGDDAFVIPDAALDERFHDNPLVTKDPGIRFYAGCPLVMSNGSALGTLCIIDRKPREVSNEELEPLRDLAHMAQQELAALQLATTDELTKLANRRGFEALSRHALDMCRKLKTSAAVLFFDLDRFKQINDYFGHAEGDCALIGFAELLTRHFRESDVISRLGGDEFAVVLTGASSKAVNAALERLREAVARHNHKAKRGYDVTYSVGVVHVDATRDVDIAALLTDADRIMYKQKHTKLSRS